MSILSKHNKLPYKCIPLLTVFALAVGGANLVSAQEQTVKPSERISVNTLRAPGATESTVKTMRKKIKETENVDRKTQEKQKKTQKKLRKNDGYVWVDYATVAISSDFDDDGFYTRISLDFDVDTDYSAIDVYARLFLSLEQGPWIEYADTDNFTVTTFGGDSYYVDSDLVEGFPVGYYDVMIEVYDAADDYLLATYGPAESGELSYLPLEDENEDSGYVNDPVVVVSDGGGGSVAGWTLLALLALAMVRLTTKRKSL